LAELSLKGLYEIFAAWEGQAADAIDNLLRPCKVMERKRLVDEFFEFFIPQLRMLFDEEFLGCRWQLQKTLNAVLKISQFLARHLRKAVVERGVLPFIVTNPS